MTPNGGLPSKNAENRYRLSVRIRLLLMITAVSTLTLILAVLAIFSYEQYTSQQSERANTAAKAALISANIKPALLFMDPRAATKSLASIEADSALISARLMLPDGSLFAQYGDAIDATETAANPDEFRIHSHDIVLGDEVIGTLQLHVSLKSFNARQQKTFSVAFTVFAVALLLSVFLAAAFQGVILRPVLAMLNHLHRIEASGNYALRLDMQRSDELGDLADGIDLMVATVEERNMDLQRHGDELQKLVEIRTQQLNQKAYYDSLTGLANRDLLNDRLEHAIKACDREGTDLAVLFMDLDRFKIINDSLGHKIGDKLLRVLGARLTHQGRGGDTVARLGGDEFVMVLEGLNGSGDAARGAQRILDALSLPFEIDGHCIHCSTSIGIAIYHRDANSADELLKCADLAMYHAKDKGRGCYSFFKEELNELSHTRLQLESAVRLSTDQQRFFLMYQPKVDLNKRRITGFEALIRSDDEMLTELGPEAYMKIADELGLTHQIGNWAINEVFRQMAEWSARMLPDVKVAVNVTANQLLSPGLKEIIRSAAYRHNIPCERLQIEIVENVFLKYSEQVVHVLQDLREMGVQIAIDDFGTGYSSMQYLQKFPLDTLKLDGMFVQELGKDGNSAGIISSVIILAHSLGLDIVAEGVETREQLQYLLDESCDIAQGYYFAKPMKADQVTTENLLSIARFTESRIEAAKA